jgi:DNA-binding NtrC family response regulator
VAAGAACGGRSAFGGDAHGLTGAARRGTGVSIAAMSAPSAGSLQASLASRTVLVIDDSEAVRTAFDVLLSLHGARVLGAGTPAEGLAVLARENVDLVIQDMNFRREATGGEEGIALFGEVRARFPEVPIVLLTAWTHLETAVELVRAGAADYIAKPWDDAKIVVTVQNLLKLNALGRENVRLRARGERARSALAAERDLCGMVYQSAELHEVVKLAVHVAPSDVPILITGPNGAGKERLAHIIYANSRRKHKPFLTVNAGALPDNLLEAELFGAEPGAFTGATKMRVGRFEAAHEGTLFLDEIGNLSPSGQMKLLRVLQTGEFERLGSSTTRKVDVRIISATNVDLPAAIREGKFREDLYFRLNVIELSLPALCDRPDDVLPLARHFVKAHATGDPPELDKSAEQALLEYDWPGNVRELENKIQRALLVSAGGPIGAAHLGLGTEASRRPSKPAPRTVPPKGRERAPWQGDDGERRQLEVALARAEGVVSRAAAELGLSRQALYRRMERLGLTVERRLRDAD